MRIVVHSGTAGAVIAAVETALAASCAEGGLSDIAVFDAAADLFASSLPVDDCHPFLAARGLSDPIDHRDLGLALRSRLARLVMRHRPRVLLLSVPEAVLWADARSLADFHRLCLAFADDVTAVLHMAHPAEALVATFAAQVALGRTVGLSDESRLAADPAGWGSAARALRGRLPVATVPSRHALVQSPVPAIDGSDTAAIWAQVFGADAVLARELPAGAATATTLAQVLADLSLPRGAAVGPVAEKPVTPRALPSVASLTRRMALNRALALAEEGVGPIPGLVRAVLHDRLADDGAPLAAKDVAALTAPLRAFKSARKTAVSVETDTGFDPESLMDSLPALMADWTRMIDTARAARTAAITGNAAGNAEGNAGGPAGGAASAPKPAPKRRGPEPLSPVGEAFLNARAKDLYRDFAGGRFWPHNAGIVGFDETAPRPDLPADPAPQTSSIVIGCMKNEGPYILEWIAYHQAIGVGHFLIFTNDCSDGTDSILDRLAELGHVTHERNDEWKGKSPQQAALNKAMKLDVVKRAEWLIHIDVDEFINIRMGNGTMAELLAAMGDATNLAMTWRLFGNAGVERIGDATVIDSFTGCSPAYCPKPHTMWGFKSMTRNIGAYQKLSCHRPNQIVEGQGDRVRWLNGSLKDATKELAQKGWRNSIGSIGFDAVQLNHYALRSRESFLIKRQRGRALHVDRSIGINYWVRHDWSRNTDLSILRNLPRMQAAKAALLADPVLARLHATALDWHHAKAEELKQIDAFRALWDQAGQLDLTDGERMAYAVAEDMES